MKLNELPFDILFEIYTRCYSNIFFSISKRLWSLRWKILKYRYLDGINNLLKRPLRYNYFQMGLIKLICGYPYSEYDKEILLESGKIYCINGDKGDTLIFIKTESPEKIIVDKFLVATMTMSGKKFEPMCIKFNQVNEIPILYPWHHTIEAKEECRIQFRYRIYHHYFRNKICYGEHDFLNKLETHQRFNIFYPQGLKIKSDDHQIIFL